MKNSRSKGMGLVGRPFFMKSPVITGIEPSRRFEVCSRKTTAIWLKPAPCHGSFTKKVSLRLTRAKVEEDRLLTLALEAGAEDVKVGDKSYEVITVRMTLRPSKKRLLRPRSRRRLPKLPSASKHDSSE